MELIHGAISSKNVCHLLHLVWPTKVLTQAYLAILVMVTCGLMHPFHIVVHLDQVWLRFMLRTVKTTFQRFLVFLAIRSVVKNTTMQVVTLITPFLDVQFLKLILSLILGYTLQIRQKKKIHRFGNSSRVKSAECLIGLLKC